MRLLQLHSDFIEYEAVRQEIAVAEPSPKGKTRYDDLVVIFISVEKDDDERTVQRAAAEIRTAIEPLKVRRLLLYPYSHLSNQLAAPEKALHLLRELEAAIRSTGLEVYRSPFGWTKAFHLQIKGHPLAEQAKVISADAVGAPEIVPHAVQAEQELRSDWFIFTPDGELTSLERFDFTRHPTLKKFADYEVTKARAAQQVPAHVSLMRRLALADYEPGSDPGNLRFYPKGRLMKALLEQYVSQRVREYGGIEVETPVMYDFKHPALASYLNRFPARQYTVKSEDKDLFLRFSACFGQFLLAKDAQFSHRQMPWRIYELTRYSFRREKSGEVTGLRRLRAFTMPDCHAFCVDLQQAKEELVRRFDLSLSVLREIGLTPEDFEMDIRFTEDFYRENREFVENFIRRFGKPVLVERWRERIFYFVLKWSFNVIDSVDKAAALSTDQIDVENGERYGITFVDEAGARRHPIILHNSPSGAIERCIYALLERAHRQTVLGESPGFPLWLSPVQVRIIPFSSRFLEQTLALAKRLEDSGIRVDVDDREETVPKRVRDAEREWIPYIIVYGEREERGRQLAVRDRRAGEVRSLEGETLIEEIRHQVAGKPFLPLPFDRQVSRRPIFSS